MCHCQVQLGFDKRPQHSRPCARSFPIIPTLLQRSKLWLTSVKHISPAHIILKSQYLSLQSFDMDSVLFPHSLCLTALRLGRGEAQAWGQLPAAAWPNGQFQALYNCSFSVNFPVHSLPLWLTQSKRLLVQTTGKAAQVQQPRSRMCAKRWKNIFCKGETDFSIAAPWRRYTLFK